MTVIRDALHLPIIPNRRNEITMSVTKPRPAPFDGHNHVAEESATPPPTIDPDVAIKTLQSLAAPLGLPPGATTAEIVNALSDLIGALQADPSEAPAEERALRSLSASERRACLAMKCSAINFIAARANVAGGRR